MHDVTPQNHSRYESYGCPVFLPGMISERPAGEGLADHCRQADVYLLHLIGRRCLLYLRIDSSWQETLEARCH
jgi:hypothetical protein